MNRNRKRAIITMFYALNIGAFLLAASISAVPASADQSEAKTGEDAHEFQEGELLVKFKAGTSRAVEKEIHDRIGATVIKEFKSINVQHVKLKTGLNVGEAIRLYQTDPQVEYAEPVTRVKILKEKHQGEGQK